jgi:hypothetical protein
MARLAELPHPHTKTKQALPGGTHQRMENDVGDRLYEGFMPKSIMLRPAIRFASWLLPLSTLLPSTPIFWKPY